MLIHVAGLPIGGGGGGVFIFADKIRLGRNKIN